MKLYVNYHDEERSPKKHPAKEATFKRDTVPTAIPEAQLVHLDTTDGLKSQSGKI